MSPTLKMLIGLAATVASAWLFHGPAGYGARLIDGLDAQVQPLVARQELDGVSATFGRDPGFGRDAMKRALTLRGPANAFQRQRFVEIMEEAQIRGLVSVGWDPASPIVPDTPPAAPPAATPVPTETVR